MITTLKTVSALAIAAAMLITGPASAGVTPKKVVGPANTSTNIGIQKPTCTTNIMCCIPGKGCFSPNTPIGYTCNGGHAEAVKTCTSPPRK